MSPALSSSAGIWHTSSSYLASERDQLAGSTGGKRPDPKADCRLSSAQNSKETVLTVLFKLPFRLISVRTQCRSRRSRLSPQIASGERIPYDLLRDEPEAPVPW